jgi:outer membrane protein assembly factor BamB
MSRLLPASIGLCLIFVASFASAQEWTRFRGPNGTGASEASHIPATWTDKDYNWKIELPGIGHSSPVLWGDKIFLLSADPKEATRFILCINASDGKIVWKRSYPGVNHHLHAYSSFASCTPALDEKNLYVAWSDPEHTKLMALDHLGNDAWSVDLGPWVSQHGFGTSPMIIDDMVVISVYHEDPKQPNGGTPSAAFVVGVDKNEGKVRWKTERKIDTTSYTVPCIRETKSGKELVSFSTGEGIFALNPADGKEKWSLPVFTMRTVSSPVMVGNLIFGTTGSGGGGNYVVAVDPNGSKPEVAFEVKKEAPYVPTPVAYGNKLFLWSDAGIVTCIDAKDGTKLGQKRIGGKFFGSPVRVKDKLYATDTKGRVYVLSADDELKELGHVDLNEECHSTPAVAGGRMYLRTISHLYSLGGKST